MRSTTKKLASTAICAAFALVAACGGGEKAAIDEKPLPPVRTNVNLVTNPSFEEWDGQVPRGWEIVHFAGDGKVITRFGRTNDPVKTGESAFFLRGLFNTDRFMVLTQRHPVRPGYTLVVSAEVASEGIKRNRGQEDNANIYVRFYDRDGERVSDRHYADLWTERRAGTSGWRRQERKISVPKNAVEAEVGIINQMTGHLYVDDVSMRLEEELVWVAEETRFVTFYHLEGHPFPGNAVSEETRMVEHFQDEYNLEVKSKIKYYWYPSEQRFMDYFGTTRYRPRRNWEEKVLNTAAPVEDHEMFHMLLVDYGYPPPGLAKGFVFVMRGEWRGWNPHRPVKNFIIDRRVPALHNIVPAEKFVETQFAITVPAWASFVKYLIDGYGKDRFLELYKAADGINTAEEFGAVFTRIYGEEFDVVDRAWRLALLRMTFDPVADSVQVDVPWEGVEE